MAPTKQGRKGHVSGDQNVKIEVSQYLLEPSEGRNPLQYWKENEYKFPILAKLAKILLFLLLLQQWNDFLVLLERYLDQTDAD